MEPKELEAVLKRLADVWHVKRSGQPGFEIKAARRASASLNVKLELDKVPVGTEPKVDDQGQLCPQTPKRPSKAISPAKSEPPAAALVEPVTPPTVGQAIFTAEITNREKRRPSKASRNTSRGGGSDERRSQHHRFRHAA